MTDSSSPSIIGLLAPEHRKVSIAIYTTIALVAFEGTSVAAALPEMAGDLGRLDLLPWVITVYLFASGVTTVMAGPLVDALGARRLFIWSAIVFSGAGFAGGLAPDLFTLIAIRFVQGGASGVLIAATLASVNLAYPSSLTGRAFAANSTIWGLMGAAAPAIAAVMLNVASWRWLFFINLPLGALALFTGRNTLPDRQPGAESPSIDWVGTGYAAVFTLSAIIATDELNLASFGFAAVTAISAVLYVRHAHRAARPVMLLRHVADDPYRSIALVPALMVGAAFATNLYVTIYVSAGRGWSNSGAAWSVLFFTIGWTVGSNLGSRLLDRFSEVRVMRGGLFTSISGITLMALFVNLDGSIIPIATGLLLMGIGVGLNTNAGLTLLRRLTEPSLIGRAGSAHQFIRNQGFTLGSAAGGSILLLVIANRIGSVEPVQRLLGGGDIDVDPTIAEAVRSGFGVTCIVALVVACIALVPMQQLTRYMAKQPVEATIV